MFEVAVLSKAMYGTRDAPQNWSKEVTRTLEEIGFEAGRSNPCVYYHSSRDLTCTVHVDDFAAVGERLHLAWLEEMLKRKYELKSEILGNGAGEVNQLTYLNRDITLTSRGIKYEACQKYALSALEEMKMMDCKPMGTPGVEGEAGEQEEMEAEDATKFRRIVAKLNYLQQDRPDISFPVNKMSQRMSKPVVGDWTPLKRIVRYLRGALRRFLWFGWQDPVEVLVAMTDSDWATCKRTRRSTSGSVLLHGSHLIRHWSRLQGGVALSSGEAELYSANKGAAEALGVIQLMRDMGVELRLELRVDASATKGMIMRQGSGKLKHVEVQQLWLQELTRQDKLQLVKIDRKVNSADVFTHRWAPGCYYLFIALGLRESVDAEVKGESRISYVIHRAKRIRFAPLVQCQCGC